MRVAIPAIAFSAIAFTLGASLANAADLGSYEPGGSVKDEPLVEPAPSNWSGLYLGAHAGWVTSDWDADFSRSTAVFDRNEVFLQARDSLSSDDAWLGGFQLGWNRQHGRLLWGVEVDVSWTSSDGVGTFLSEYDPCFNGNGCTQWDVRAKLDLAGTVRARIGYLPTPRLLLYGSGGLAWGVVNTKLATTSLFTDEALQRLSGDVSHIGWAAGAGGEYSFADNLSIKAEWLYVGLGEEKYVLDGRRVADNSPARETFHANLDFHTIRVGVNYRFAH